MSKVATQWILDLKQNITQQLQTIDQNLQTTDKNTQSLTKSLKNMSAIDLYAIANSIQQLNTQFQSAIAPGATFEAGLKEVEAITGVTGDALDALGLKARKSAKEFGGSASDSLNTYKVILSRLGPDIAENQEALAGMESNARILSKTMNNDLSAATDALTTAMLQYKVDLQDPMAATEEMTNMMNIMAAGAKYGSAEVPSISQALKVAGVQAKQSNVQFGEINAALQELARGGKEGSEAGTGLRNVLAKMSGEDILPNEAVNKLRALGIDMSIVSDTTLPFTERLREMKKAQADATLIAQVFGLENAATANILLDSIDAQEDLQSKIVGTNTAMEQADVIMSGYNERMSRWKARMSDWGISLFNMTKNIAPVINVVAQLGMVYANLENVLKLVNFQQLKDLYLKGLNIIATNGLIGTLGLLTKATWGYVKSLIATGFNLFKNIFLTLTGAAAMAGGWIGAMVGATMATLGFNGALLASPIGMVIGWVVGLIAIIGMLISIVKSFIQNWEKIKAAFRDGGILEGIKAIGKAIIDGMLAPIQKLLELAAKIPGLKGIAGKGSDYILEMRRNLWGGEVETKKKKEAASPFGMDPEMLKYLESMGIDPNAITTPTGSNLKTGGNMMEGTGSAGAGKSITMNLEIVNHFNVDKGMNIDYLADQIIGKVNDRLRDAMVAV